KADLRSTTTVIEAYRVDYGAYPLYYNSDDGKDYPSDVNYEVTFLSYFLTTPIAYMTSLLRDPYSLKFGSEGQGGAGTGYGLYTYYYRRKYPAFHPTWTGPGGHPVYEGNYVTIAHIGKAYDCYNHTGWFLGGEENQSVQWVIGSGGPSLVFPTLQRATVPMYASVENPTYPELRYDATNGSKSHGDILQFGP
ncbi:MAG TPA: hypothetical protein VM492_00920, partial [Sumerlaeia bacterium]|nr:hypothetical protein [Sumerlaeia bacterium]